MERKLKIDLGESPHLNKTDRALFIRLFNVVADKLEISTIDHTLPVKFDLDGELRHKTMQPGHTASGSTDTQYPFGVMLRPDAFKDTIKVFVHEMIHIRQLLTGQLSATEDKKIMTWEGDDWSLERTKDHIREWEYRTLPWEIPAFTQTPVLFASVLKELPELEDRWDDFLEMGRFRLFKKWAEKNRPDWNVRMDVPEDPIKILLKGLIGQGARVIEGDGFMAVEIGGEEEKTPTLN